MLEVAHMGLHVAQMTSHKGIRQCFNAVTVSAARVMYMRGCGLEVGCDAFYVLLQARDTVGGDPVAGKSIRVWKKGTLLAETGAEVAKLQLPQRPSNTAFHDMTGSQLR